MKQHVYPNQQEFRVHLTEYSLREVSARIKAAIYDHCVPTDFILTFEDILWISTVEGSCKVSITHVTKTSE